MTETGASSKISVVAKVVAGAGRESEVRASLTEAVRAVEHEAGTELYSVHQDAADPAVFWMFELYRDAEAVQEHRRSDAMRSLVADMRSLTESRGEIHVLAPVAAKGLDL
jgi:(4S)-4-hydroxy-5-phosphonooxypentane-2,3-dione isomerase